jgi:hypothetical protein
MEVMEARIAQAKANLTLPFFLGTTAAGSSSEAIVWWSSSELVPVWQGRHCDADHSRGLYRRRSQDLLTPTSKEANGPT